MELIRLEKITFAYEGYPPFLLDLDFILHQGDRVGILGANGAGKSTMFQVAMGLLKPQAGKVMALGNLCRKEADFRVLREKVGYLFQDPDDQLFCPTVLEDVAFGPLNLGRGPDEAKAIAGRTLGSLGLEGFEKRVTYQLSGGEKRLVSLAAVLAMEPLALILDEPSTGLDPEHEAHLEKSLLASDLSWALISHDRGLLQRTCHKILRLEAGRLWEV